MEGVDAGSGRRKVERIDDPCRTKRVRAVVHAPLWCALTCTALGRDIENQ